MKTETGKPEGRKPKTRKHFVLFVSFVPFVNPSLVRLERFDKVSIFGPFVADDTRLLSTLVQV